MAPKKRKSVAENVEAENVEETTKTSVNDASPVKKKSRSDGNGDVVKKEVDIKREADETSISDAPPVKKSRSEKSDDIVKKETNVTKEIDVKKENDVKQEIDVKKEIDVKEEKDVTKDVDVTQKTSLVKESEVTADVATPDRDDEDVVVSKKRRQGRKRMKKVYSGILQQMEFYFSDANLAKSNFMQVNFITVHL